ncbi:PGAP1-like protein [Scopulibacillus darangshiensis]|uniref:PGAP1-like protein n=1 Tax=Scopulibacillus darangshiensis TaxID=442528 RepID=A0A4R2PAA3_9BACL|nr:alpha/beta fold hydrolase [Scopulibacillus darangshiensis]TCP31298.1 PGAP1-like protein [Scopulibacillus darangshiensis]
MINLGRLFTISLAAILPFMINDRVKASTDGVKDSTKTKIPEPKVVQGPKAKKLPITGVVGNGNDETPGEWYAGATPANLRADAPVLLFVQGLNSTADVWWEDNNMYDTAYNQGYQTAFVQLYDAGGTSASMWKNGQLLSEKIKEISEHFNHKPITIVAHSKGGVDSQTALTYYGAWKYVDNVITLSGPHHGSELANLAYSYWAGWLADILGLKGEGTYVLQTGYMDHFRTQTDVQLRVTENDYYTLGGTDWGSAFSATWLGGLYLSRYGASDGAVRVTSSRLPEKEGRQVAIGDWNHFSIRTGVTFPVFQDYLMGDLAEESAERFTGKSAEAIAGANRWIHGGKLAGAVNESISIPVEDDVKSLTIDLLTKHPLSKTKLFDSTGKQVKADIKTTKTDNVYFRGTIHNFFTLQHPKPGNLQLKLTASQDDAYLLTADFATNKKIKLQKIDIKRSKSLSKDYKLSFQLKANPSRIDPQTLKAAYHITKTGDHEHTKSFMVSGTADLSKEMTLTEPNQVYNITVDIEGLTNLGNPFKRTFIDSVYTE